MYVYRDDLVGICGGWFIVDRMLILIETIVMVMILEFVYFGNNLKLRNIF